MNLVESKAILKIEKEKKGDERQQFNIKRNELVESGKGVPFSDAKYDYVIKKNQVVKGGVVYDNLDYDLDIEKGKKKEEIEKEFAEVQMSANTFINKVLRLFVGLAGFKVNEDGLVVFNSGISQLDIRKFFEDLFNLLPDDSKKAGQTVYAFIKQVLEGAPDEAREIGAFINLQILNKKKKSELLAQLEVATTLEEVQAIDVEKAKQEVQIELAGLTGLNGVEGVEGL